MLDGCNEIHENLKTVMLKAAEETERLGGQRVGTEHLLLALTHCEDPIVSSALASMKIDSGALEKEMEKLINQKDFADCELSHNELPGNNLLSQICFKDNKSQCIRFSDQAIKTLANADNISHYLGQDKINVSHFLLALIEQKDCCANKIFEELSINVAFLRGKIMHFMAVDHLKHDQMCSLRSALVCGLKGLIEKHSSALCTVQELIQASKLPITQLPRKEEVLHAVCTAYLAECLYNQVAFQRYLLEETLNTLSEKIGSLSEEIASQIVSTNAQHLRKQARQAIEYIWTDEYRLIQHMLNDAEYDLIGSVIEDLWWMYSEDIALDKSFTDALADHRKPHSLDLQKRRVELSQRLRKLKNRLEDTIKQCFQTRV